MRTLDRNKQAIFYRVYLGETEIIDDNGYNTGERRVEYAEPMLIRANVSTAKGEAQAEAFGTAINYDKVIVISDLNCPINENTVILLNAEELLNASLLTDSGEVLTDDNSTPLLVDIEGDMPPFDYVVRKVAKSLNYIAYAVSKVDVS